MHNYFNRLANLDDICQCSAVFEKESNFVLTGFLIKIPKPFTMLHLRNLTITLQNQHNTDITASSDTRPH